MSEQQKLGGDRVGTGAGMEVEMPQYGRANHNLNSKFRSPIAMGTITPVMALLGLRGDTFDIEFNVDIQTPGTIGALFGSAKFQIDVYSAPWRLYMGLMHNNALNIGNKMAQVQLPQMMLEADISTWNQEQRKDVSISQINQSSIFAYMGVRGVGRPKAGTTGNIQREFNALKVIAYYDICKNYYWNKQENLGAIIHTRAAVDETVGNITLSGSDGNNALPQGGGPTQYLLKRDSFLSIVATGAPGARTELEDVMLYTSEGRMQAQDIWRIIERTELPNNGGIVYVLKSIDRVYASSLTVTGWDYATPSDDNKNEPKVYTFDLEDIDKTRDLLMGQTLGTHITLSKFTTLSPWKEIFETNTDETDWSYRKTQEGLAVGTYQSDKFNNWLNSDTIAGAGGVNELSRIVIQNDGQTDYINVDQINIATKVQKLLNAVAAAGGGFWDYQDAVWGRGNNTMVFSPVYHGGLSKELIFQEVTTMAATEVEAAGSIVGRGRFNGKHKGGKVVVRVDEPSYIIGLAKLTPRLDYSQGNRWDNNLKNMNELHKPLMDRIGLQDLIIDEMAWWDTEVDAAGVVTYKSAGKQPAWTQYTTDYNEVFGAFAEQDSMMYMTFNRRYEKEDGGGIKDLTTIIDPGKYNYIFSQTSLDAMNYYLQVDKKVEARRKVSNKQMPQV